MLTTKSSNEGVLLRAMQRPGLAPLFETIVFLTAALAVDLLWGHADRFADVYPHPFWIPVLLISAFYGTSAGLLAATLSTAALLVGHLPDPGFGENASIWLLHTTSRPVLWYIVALVLGENRDSQIRRRDALSGKLKEARVQAEAIAEAYEKLLKTKEDLEVTVAAQATTVRTVHAAAQAIERDNVADSLAGIAEFIRGTMKPKKFSVFLIQDGRLDLQSADDWGRDETFSRSFDASSALYDAVIRRGRLLTLAEPEDESILPGEGVIAGPLTCPKSGETIGMLKIEAIDFLDFDVIAVQNFALACDWIGQSLERARALEATQPALPADTARPLAPSYLSDSHRAKLQKIAKEFGVEATSLLLSLDLPPHSLTDGATALAEQSVADAETRHAAAIDLLFDRHAARWDYDILLLGADARTAQIMADRIAGRLRKDFFSGGSIDRLQRIVTPLHERPAPFRKTHARS